jgi:O-antigen/teichoic acid export membrane protein
LILSPFLIQPLLKVPFAPYIPLIMFPALLGQLSLLGSVFLRSTLKAKEYTILNFVVFLTTTSVTLILLTKYNMGIKANLYAGAIGAVITLIFFIYISLKYSLLKFKFEFKTLWVSLMFALPLIPNIAGGWIGGLSDRLIMTYYGKIEQVGLYSVSAQIALILYMVNDAITQVQGPIALSALTNNQEEGKRQISQFLSLFTWFILFCYLLLVLYSKEILYLMTDERFHSAYKLVSILAFLYVLSGVYRIFTTIISFHGKMWVISSAAIVSASLSMILNFIFIPYFGQWAAAWASLLSMFGYTMWLVYWSQKIDHIEINYSLIFVCLTLAIFIVTANYYLDRYYSLSLISNILIKIALMFVYVTPVFLLKSLSEIKTGLLQIKNKLKQNL